MKIAMDNRITVVVVTKNRQEELKHCLGSLACQSISLENLVVVDNNSSDETQKVVKNFSKNVKFKVSYVKHRLVGYPHVYNRGLKEAKGDWIAFIDDDCVADFDWFSRIKLITARLPKFSAILGHSSEYHKKSIVALSRSYVDEIGKIGAIKKNIILDHEILDSKNVIYNKKFLDKHRINFDIQLLKYAQGASEDCDLGMQIFLARGLAYYDKTIKVVHKDPVNFWQYYKKASFTLLNHLVYEKKWSRIRSGINTQRPLLSKLELFVEFKNKHSLSLLKTFLISINVGLTYIYVKVLRHFYKLRIKDMQIVQK
ncbi:MAG: glycosyltransferase family 2 protein [Pseudomonadales bacterium]|nr:glycosyltransferase family 2 protein [Pseudomonadales bacterium]